MINQAYVLIFSCSSCSDLQYHESHIIKVCIDNLDTQVILVDGVLVVFTEEMERAPSAASGVLSRQISEK